MIVDKEKTTVSGKYVTILFFIYIYFILINYILYVRADVISPEKNDVFHKANNVYFSFNDIYKIEFNHFSIL